MPPKSLRQQGGFTLLELLIVIVIVGILGLLIIPNIIQAPGKNRDTQRKTQPDADKSGLRAEGEGITRKADNTVEPDAQRTEQAIVIAAAGKPGRTVEKDRCLLEPDQRRQAAQKTVRFLELADFVNRAPRQQSEIAGVGWNFDIGNLVDDPVTDMRDNPL